MNQNRNQMRIWILFGFIFGLSVGSTTTVSFVDWINGIRKEYRDSILSITGYEIQELVYDVSMCNIPRDHYNEYRLASFNLEDHDIYKTELNEYLTLENKERETINKQRTKSSVPYLEMIVPLQERFCCNGTGNQNEILCIFGPEATLNSLKSSKNPTSCSYGYQKIDGLCNIIDPFIKSNAPSDAQDARENLESFVKQINIYRSKAAEYHKIVNMHKLIMNHTICERAEKLNKTPSTWEGVYSTFRWTIFDDEKQMERRGYEYSTFDEKHINKVNGFDKRWFIELEVLLPKQKEFCCVPKIIEGFNKKQYLCLFEPEGKFSSWNEPRGEPGKRCDDGYGYDSGEKLCTLVITKMAEVIIAKNEPPVTTTIEIPTTSSTTKFLETSTAKSDTQPKSITDSNAPSSQNNGDPPAAESPIVTPIPVPSAQTTTMSEMDKKIKKYKDTETDGDEVEVEQFEDYDDSSNVIPIMITVVFVVLGFL